MQTLQGERYPTHVTITDDEIIVTLTDGTRIGNPLNWFPWLENASPSQQQNYKLYAYSIDWEELDEGIDIEGMLRGIKPRYPQPVEN